MDRKKVDKIADKISAHLKRFENDPEINIPPEGQRMKIHPYYGAHASRTYGPTVSVTYISFQGPSKLTPEDAVLYLKWLDKGNVGKHYKVLS